ncbi:hypothetical protein SAMN02910369_02261 [Lachnospiraceae bacterium NE2001]|nr:hypothetical protein SAMN02910369_02261 [Lachnospiraceae bacterium NE2001]
MAGKNRLNKRRAEYLKAKGIYASAKRDDPLYEQKIALAEAYNALAEKMEVDEPLSADAMKSLAELYKDVLDKSHQLSHTAQELIQGPDKRKYDVDSLKNQIAQNDFLSQKLDKDLKAIEKTAEKNEQKSLNDIYETSRVNSNYDVLPDENRSSSHGAQNSRIAVTLKDKTTGAEIKGYFTLDNKAREKKSYVKETFENAKKKWGKAADFITLDSLEKTYEDFKCSYSAMLSYIANDMEQLSFMPYKDAHAALTKNLNDFLYGKELLKMIDTPEKLKIFVNVAKPVYLAENIASVANTTGIEEGQNINRRNAAMSEVAALLGHPNLLAQSENVKINIDGQEMKGTFMKEAKGDDIKKLGIDSDFLKVGMESLNELELKKTLADIQIVDYICGNPDRHGGNMLYSLVKNQDGTISIKTAQGIDNDTCLGTRNYDGISSLSPTHLQDINVITKEMSEKVMALTPEKLKQTLYGFKLSSEEIDNSIERLKKLQEKVVADQKLYSKGYGKGYLVENTIKVVNDEELDELRINEDLRIRNGGKNIFNRATSIANAKSRINDTVIQARDKYYETAYKATTDGLGKLNQIITSMNKDSNITDISPKYSEMVKNMEALKKMIVNVKGPIIGEKVDVSNGHTESIIKIREQMNKTVKSVYEYRDYKYSKTKGEEWREAGPGHVVTRQERRFNHSTDALNLLMGQLEMFDKLDENLKTYNEYNSKKASLLEAAEKREEDYKKSDKVKHQKEVYEKNMLQNHISRSEYKTLEAFEKIQKAETPEARGIAQIEYDLILGYSVAGLKPEDREAYKKRVSEQTGTEITASDDELLKKAFASQLVLTKYECQQVDEKRRDFDHNNVLKNLENLDITDPEKAVNILMRNKGFGKLFTKNKDDMLITKGCEKLSTVAIPTFNKVSILTTNLVNEIKRGAQRETNAKMEKGPVH